MIICLFVCCSSSLLIRRNGTINSIERLLILVFENLQSINRDFIIIIDICTSFSCTNFAATARTAVHHMCILLLLRNERRSQYFIGVFLVIDTTTVTLVMMMIIIANNWASSNEVRCSHGLVCWSLWDCNFRLIMRKVMMVIVVVLSGLASEREFISSLNIFMNNSITGTLHNGVTLFIVLALKSIENAWETSWVI